MAGTSEESADDQLARVFGLVLDGLLRPEYR
jgi:hypothetical protein